MRKLITSLLACVLLLALRLPAAESVLTGEKLNLHFSEGRWSALDDAGSGQELMGGGDRLAPVVVTFGGHTSVTTGRAQLWSIVDAETAGQHSKFAAEPERSSGGLVFET